MAVVTQSGNVKLTSSNVLPTSPSDHTANARGIYPVLSGKVNWSCAKFGAPSNISNGSLGQFGETVGVSSWSSFRVGDTASSILSHHVSGVIDNGAEKEVLRSDTRRVVTMVEHPQSINDRAVVEFPRESAGPDAIALHPEEAIASIVYTSSPHPARAEFGSDDWAILVDLRPEPLFGRSDDRHILAGDATKLSCPVIDLIGNREEWLGTLLTDPRNTGLVSQNDHLTLSLIVHHMECA